MKKFIVVLSLLGLFLTSCGDMGKEAETKEAQKVEENTSTSTVLYTNLLPDSYVEWRASHLGGVSKRYGKVQISGAKAKVDQGKLVNAKAAINLNTLTVESFEEGSEQAPKLTAHLKSEDFFDVANYPTALFELTAMDPMSGEYNAKVTGNLTIKGVTKSISFPANVLITDNSIVVDSEPFTVDRNNWGLSYHRKGTPGVPVDYLISDDIGFTIHLKLGK